MHRFYSFSDSEGVVRSLNNFCMLKFEVFFLLCSLFVKDIFLSAVLHLFIYINWGPFSLFFTAPGTIPPIDRRVDRRWMGGNRFRTAPHLLLPTVVAPSLMTPQWPWIPGNGFVQQHFLNPVLNPWYHGYHGCVWPIPNPLYRYVFNARVICHWYFVPLARIHVLNPSPGKQPLCRCDTQTF